MSTVTAEQQVVNAVPKQLLIGGEWRAAQAGATLAVEDPSTGEALCEIADADVADGDAALAAASAAQAAWGAHPPRERGEILRRAFEEIIERADELALLMTLEMGKAVAESRAEIVYAAEFLRWFSEEASRIHGRYAIPPNGQGRMLVMRQPVGPCLFITPWNFPLAMGTRKIGPAIAAGCTMVVKPAQLTPLSMLALADILQRAGLPDGVLNVLTSHSSGKLMGPLIADSRARKLSFTGSTEVGQKLMAQAAEQVLRVSMELGGNAPFLVFDDADVNAAVAGAMVAKMRNVGEACTAANRFHVAAGVSDEFTEKLAQRMSALRVGRGTDPSVDVGPLIDDTQRSKVDELRPGRARPRREGDRGRHARAGTRVLLRADGTRRRPGRRAAAARGDLRPGGAGGHVLRRAGGDRLGQQHRVRPRRLRLHTGSRPGVPRDRGAGDRDGGAQPGNGVQRRRSVRRGEAVGVRA